MYFKNMGHRNNGSPIRESDFQSLAHSLPRTNSAQVHLVPTRYRTYSSCSQHSQQVSAISDSENPTNIIQDLFQGQLCLWSLIAMCIYSAFWQRHRKKLIASTFICTPVIITTCITISWLIGIMIIICRLFSLTMINPLHVFGLGRPQSSSRGTPYGSHRGSIDSVNGGILPQPNCQMHASNASLNSLGMRTARKRSLAQAEGSFDL